MEALRFLPLGRLIEKSHGSPALLTQLYDCSGRYWRVRFADGDWEEITRREVEQFLKGARTRQSGTEDSGGDPLVGR